MGHVSTQAVGLVWYFLDGGLSWLRRLFRDGFVKCLYIRVGDSKLPILLGHWVCLIGVFSGLDCLHNSNSMVFGKFDSSSDLRFKISPDLT